MPKTLTDDAPASMPSSINGPLLVADGADHGSFIQLHPALARITGRGTARSLRVLRVESDRTYGATVASLFGGGLTARTVRAYARGGFYLWPFRIPVDMDVAEPSRIRTLVQTTHDASVNGQAVLFRLGETHVSGGGPIETTELDYAWSVPDNWTTGDSRVVLLDVAGGQTFTGGHWQHGQVVGLRLSREGADPADTYGRWTMHAQFLEFEYTALIH